MTKIIFISLTVIGLCFLSSCKKNDKNSVSGIITDMSSNQKIEGVRILLDASSVTSGSISSNFTNIGETSSDADGKYFLEFDNRAYLKFKLLLSKEAYHSSSFTWDPTDHGADYLKDRKLAKKSFIKIIVLNTIPKNDDDVLKIRIENINSDCDICCNSDFRFFYGASIDTTFVCPVVGGDSVTIHSISIHDGESYIREHKVYCTPNDTVIYNCYY